MLNENNTLKYLKYAVGEILLVMIGIILALQVNNWNENQHTISEIALTIQNLNKEFQSNYETLIFDLSRLEKVKNTIYLLRSEVDKLESDPNTSVLDSLINEVRNWPTWNPSTYVFNDLRQTGKISAIRSEKLKKLLYDYEKHYGNILEWHKSIDEGGQKLTDYLVENGVFINTLRNLGISKSKFDTTNKILLRNIKFENQIARHFMNVQGLIDQYKIMIVIIENILDETKD